MKNTVKKRILIIEDDKSVLQLIRMYLVNDGFTVIDSYDGLDGLNKTLTETPDLVLLDLNLPKMDGIVISGSGLLTFSGNPFSDSAGTSFVRSRAAPLPRSMVLPPPITTIRSGLLFLSLVFTFSR